MVGPLHEPELGRLVVGVLQLLDGIPTDVPNPQARRGNERLTRPRVPALALIPLEQAEVSDSLRQPEDHAGRESLEHLVAHREQHLLRAGSGNSTDVRHRLDYLDTLNTLQTISSFSGLGSRGLGFGRALSLGLAGLTLRHSVHPLSLWDSFTVSVNQI